MKRVILFMTRIVIFTKRVVLERLRYAIEILLRENQSEVSLYPKPKQRMPPIKLTMP